MSRSKPELYTRIREILDSARSTIARSVNSTHVVANWMVGREIVEDEQKGRCTAAYGKRVIANLSEQLQKEFGSGYSPQNLFYMRQFYIEYPTLIDDGKIFHAVRGETTDKKILHALRGISDENKKVEIQKTTTDNPYKPGKINANLSWTHYRILLKVKKIEARSFYEIETVKNGWGARELERQIDSLLFERLLKSRNKKGVMELATRGHEVVKPVDIIKDPVILEFIDLPESYLLNETEIETALIFKLKNFLLELGNGFAFVGRQKRLSLDGDHFYTDLVFYHIKLKCYVIIDLKVKKLTHGDIGQMLMYVHYYDREIKEKADNPSIGIILCTDKNDAVAKYVLDEKSKQIFTSRYQFELPTIEELQRELKREMTFILPENKRRPKKKK